MKTVARQTLTRLADSSIMRRFTRSPLVSRHLPWPAASRIPLTGPLVIDHQGIKFTYNTAPRDGIGRLLNWRQSPGFEPETISVFSALASSSQLVVDVGAHTGLFTLFALSANPDTRVICFEPVQEVRSLLISSIHDSGWEDRCEVSAMAVGATSHISTMHVPELSSGLPLSARLGASGYRGAQGELRPVDVTTLDEFIDGTTSVDLVKIDVEGREPAVLAGMRRILEQDNPDVVLECNTDGDVDGIRAAFHENYSIWRLTHAGPKKVASIEPDPAEQERNFLFTTKPDSEILGLRIGTPTP